MTSFVPPVVRPSQADPLLLQQGSSLCYDGYQQLPFFGDSADTLQSQGHTASFPDSGLESGYPYHPESLLRFEEELANNYLAVPPLYPTAFADTPVPSYDSSIPIPDVYQAIVAQQYDYAQWYTASVAHGPPSGADLSQQTFPYSAYPMDATSLAGPSSIAQTCNPASVTPGLAATHSGYSTIADALDFSSFAQNLPDPSTSVNAAPPPIVVEVAMIEDAPPPFPATQTRQRRSRRTRAKASSPIPYPIPVASSSSSSSSASERDPSPPAAPKFVSTPRRNVAVAPDALPLPHANPWRCPFCTYVQWNKRSPDLKRHVDTHTRSTEDEPDFVCCGVPREDAGAHGVPSEVAKGAGFEYEGRTMVGGCRKTFSRRDAFARHLRNYEGACYGDALAPYQRGNKGRAH